jgi:hypothetical protein
MEVTPEVQIIPLHNPTTHPSTDDHAATAGGGGRTTNIDVAPAAGVQSR